MEQSLSHFNDSHSDTNWDHSNTLLSDLDPALQPPNGKHDQNRKQLVSFISQWICYTPNESLSQCTVTRISEVTFPNAKLALGPHQKKQLNYFPGSQVRLTVMPPIKEHESEWIPKPFFTTRPRYKRGANGQKKHICSTCYSVSWRDQKRRTPTPRTCDNIQTVRKDTFELSWRLAVRTTRKGTCHWAAKAGNIRV